jgi:hypothetical protein
MKNNRVDLYQWLPSEGETIEIDWPKVHKKIGVDQTRWLLKQPNESCQLVLEQKGTHCKLIAEFYNETTLLNYHLMWAK